jgi:6,7-dimethyl-8-ribityllumazine synthase
MIAIIKANFNATITDLLLAGCTDELDAKNQSYKVFECAGAVETVVFANRIIETNQYDCVVVIGAIIKGDTDHYEYVCQYVTQGFATIAATKTTPVIFGILTTQNEALAYERAAIDKMNKGQEFAVTAMEMIQSFKSL